MSRCSSQAFVLPLGQVPRLSWVEVGRHYVGGRVAGAVTGLLQEAEEGADHGQLAPSGRAGECLPVKVRQETLKMAALYLLDGQDIVAKQVVDQLSKIRKVLAPRPRGEIPCCQMMFSINRN